MHRRQLLISLSLPLAARAQNLEFPRTSPVDAVAFYLIPTDDVSENATAEIARTLTKAFNLNVKSTTWAPSDVKEPIPGTNQYPSDDYLPMGARLARTLRDTSPRTYFIVITNRDINTRSLNFRFQYSTHGPMANTSVLSYARLLHDNSGASATNQVANARVLKMLVRIIGEMRLGWKRSSDPLDVMFAPIMSLEDIDRIDIDRSMQERLRKP
jgi:predicted Zn-dependent protease